MPAAFRLRETVVQALVVQIAAQMPGQVSAINAAINDGYPIDPPNLVLPYAPFPAEINVPPVIGITDLEGTVEDDLVTSATGLVGLSVVYYVHSADHADLIWKLRRYGQAVAASINADRSLGGACWTTVFDGWSPGPLAGATDPASSAGWLTLASWQISCKGTEI